MAKRQIKVLVFGTFDGIHDGHRYFLREARKFGDKLIVAVAKDSTVNLLKGHLPEAPLPNRIMTLKAERLADEVLPGDQEIGQWKIVERLKPDVICVGYDQEKLREELEKVATNFSKKFEIKILEAKNGDTLHSRFLRKT